MNKNVLESQFDKVLQQDIEAVVSAFPFTERLKGKCVLITGATGLIGSQLVRTFACFNRLFNTQMKILAFARNEEKARTVFGELLARGDVVVKTGDIHQPMAIEDEVDYLIHGASATSSRYFVSNPVETIMTAITGTKNVLDFAYQKKVESTVYLSSLEVYGTPLNDALIQEADYGYIDPLNVRSSYSESKRMAECLCVSYAHEYQVPVKIARLSQTFGAGVEYADGRVFAEFARCANEKRNIVLRTQGATVRSYCYTADAISAILFILTKGVSGEAYNVTNMNTSISIRDMAQLVCDMFPQAGISVRFDIPEDVSSFGFNPEMVIKLDSGKLDCLGWTASTGLQAMYQRLLESWKCQAR